MNVFLDPKYLEDFVKIINSSPIFSNDERYTDFYNLSAVVIDRVRDSINYLNGFPQFPSNDQEYILFIVYACIVRDGINELYRDKNIKLKYEYDKDNPKSYKYFKKICSNRPLKLADKDIPTDDKFFEYFRSLTLAHPYETNRIKFLKDNKETHYSPFLIPHRSRAFDNSDLPNRIGVRIYSNKFEEIKDLYLSFDTVKEYLYSRYILIENVTQKVKDIINEESNCWRQYSITLQDSYKESLKLIIDTLEKRFEYTYGLHTLYQYLTCELTNQDNRKIINLYREKIIETIPQLIQKTNSLEHERLHQIVDQLLYTRPKELHSMGNYELEKIYSYLNDENPIGANYEWGLKMAKSFYEAFSHKWVEIDVETMSATEIKLLTTVACYFEVHDLKK